MDMKKVVIGSSNIYSFYCFYKYLDKKDQDSIKLHKCKRIALFKALMDALEDTEPYVIVSVIENFVFDAVGEITVKEEIERIATSVLIEFA